MLWLRQQEVGDQLRLLAAVAGCLGTKGVKDYQPPADNFADLIEEQEAADWEGGTEERMADVIAFAQAAGGETG